LQQGSVQIGVVKGGITVAGLIAPDVEQQRVDFIDGSGIGSVAQPCAVKLVEGRELKNPRNEVLGRPILSWRSACGCEPFVDLRETFGKTRWCIVK
jgi:hypothetical protein